MLAVVLLVSGCSGFASKVSRRFGGKMRLTVQVDPQLNQDFPLAVDTLVVYDKSLYGKLTALTAEEWFAQRDQYRVDNVPKNLEITSREWVPRCAGCPQPAPVDIEHRIGARGAIVFCHYFNPGTHRIVVEPISSFTLKLGETEASPEPAAKQSRAERKEAKKAARRDRRKKAKGAETADSGSGS